MSYIVVKTINGRRYRYLQRSYRVGKKVRTESIYLGPADGGVIRKAIDLIGAQRPSAEDRALASAERQAARIDAEQRAQFGETASERADRARQEHLDKLHDLHGLKLGPSNPTPVDKEVTPAPSTHTAPSDEQTAPTSEQSNNNDASADPDAGAAASGQDAGSGSEATAP